jgi:2-polyprenyl-6-methoxyphenol hydroxylase-like FAD-dependent oxidoreductase
MNAEYYRVPVLVVGAGPVGLTLGMDLASRSVGTLLVDSRSEEDKASPKCNHTSSRSMEVFRRLGCAAAVRARGLPRDHVTDVSYVTRLSGFELGRVRMPAAAQRYEDRGYADGGWPTPEPTHRICQFYLEPVLREHARTFESLTMLFEVSLERYELHDTTIRAYCVRKNTHAQIIIDADYLIGCDGARSTVRHQLGIRLEGDDRLMQAHSIHFRSQRLLQQLAMDAAWLYWIINPQQTGAIIAINGTDEFVAHSWIPGGQNLDPAFDVVNAVRAMSGSDIDITVIQRDDWTARRMVVPRLSVGRVFLAGDAAHIWIPMSGYGMNAGIADAVNLAWKLAAVIHGWADEAILETYHSERQPITEQISRFAMNIRRKNDIVVPPEIEEDSPRGAQARDRVGQYMVNVDSIQFRSQGLNFGYFYRNSAIIVADGAEPPAYTLESYTPSTVPGCRAPHIWLAGHVSLYDTLDAGYSLLRTDPSIDVGALEAAARARGFPLQRIDVGNTHAEYDYPLVIVRPDQHIAWRGSEVPVDPTRLIDILSGRSAAN